MKTKRFLSTVVAGALVAAQMAMPVMAADGGQVDVDVTTKTGVLRVEVPTTMAIAVDQFEITQAGAQIASGEFDMTNKSEMAVKVTVASTVDLDTAVKLVAAKEDAEQSAGSEAWLAVAAKTAASSYDDASTADDTENYWDLSETNGNVTTFAADTKKAEQTYYLEKAAGTAEYALAVPKNNEASVSYAQFYELTAIATQPTDDDGLQAEVDKADVYVVVTANNGKDGEAVTKIAKGETVASGTYAAANTYYTAADAASASVTDGKLYVYASMNADGGKAGFTYVGKLSNAKDTWTKDDIKKVSIAYTITGVTASKFDEVKDDCTYGLYADKPAGPQVSITEDAYITITGLTADQNYKSLAIEHKDGTTSVAADMEWHMDNWSEKDGGDLGIQLKSKWTAWLAGQEVTIKLTLTDDTVVSATVTLAE